MNTHDPHDILLVGAGSMAGEYAKVLRHLGARTTVIGRGARSADSFKSQTGLEVQAGGLQAYLARSDRVAPHAAIVAVGIDVTASAVRQLLEAGCKHILVEKPGGIDSREIRSLANEARAQGASVYLAYNRRFYAAVRQARAFAEEDGGLTSVSFDFTEWSHVIEPLPTPLEVKGRWFLANSTHVVDTVFHLAGVPEQLSSFRSGGLAWHPSASVFSGAGVTVRGIPFNYHANWESAGRWGIELHTRKRKLILRPMEVLSVQQRGSVSTQVMEPGTNDDEAFKPGLLRQTAAFLGEDSGDLCRLEDHATNVAYYDLIAGY